MNILSNILSERQRYTSPSWTIVYEWENIIAKSLNLEVLLEGNLKNRIISKVARTLNIEDVVCQYSSKGNLALRFESVTMPHKSIYYNRNNIPVIIDFWLKDEDIPLFFQIYKNVPLILLTNREVYEKFIKLKCPIPFEHWPLSMPDEYALTRDENYKKEIELALLGRANPFFERMLETYSTRHPDFVYVTNKLINNQRHYFNNRGDLVAVDAGRDFYINFIRKIKISCYSTPGIDESKTETKEYNQVTPRVFEMLCNGCQVIGHYPYTADTIWYGLDQIVPNVNSYQEFEQCLDNMRKEDADLNKIKMFMSQHYTSKRVEMLKDILAKHNISIVQNTH